MIHYRSDRARQRVSGTRIIQQPRTLIAIVEGALCVHRIAPTRFGRDALGDSRLVGDLRAGRRPRAATRAAILAHVDRLAAGQGVRP